MTYPGLSPRQDPHAFVEQYRTAYPEDVLLLDEVVAANEGITGLIYELTDRGSEQMLVCNKVEGVDVGVVSNVFASRRRIARLLDTEPDQLHQCYQERATRPLPPRIVEDGPILEVLTSGSDVDLATVPMLRHFASDRSPYITSGIILAEDPDTGVGNMSYHRSMPHSATELATSLHSRGDLWRMCRSTPNAARSCRWPW